MARLRSLLIVDFDNINAAIGASFVEGVEKWVRWLEDGAFAPGQRKRRFVARRVYWNLQHDKHRDQFVAAGFEAFNCRAFARNKEVAGKSSADIVMTMDALEFALTRKGIEEVILLTTDSDFVPVVNRLQAHRMRVVSAGKETDPTHQLYRKHADDVIHMAAIKAACDYQPEKRKWYSLKRPPVAIAELVYEQERNSPLMRKVRKAVNRKESPESSLTRMLQRATELVADLGQRTPDQPLSKVKISRALSEIETFSTVPRKKQAAWLGQRSYAGLMRQLAKVDPRIEVRRMKGNGTQVIFRMPPAADPVEAENDRELRQVRWTDATASITG